MREYVNIWDLKDYGIPCRITPVGVIKMKKRKYLMSDEEFAALSQKYPNLTQSDVSEIVELLAEKVYADMALHAQQSEIEQLKSKALGAMGTDGEMRFSDIELGMLRASLSDGRQALKEIMESAPVETPSGSDGIKMENQGRKKKHNDGSGGGGRR